MPNVEHGMSNYEVSARHFDISTGNPAIIDGWTVFPALQ
jgi:hypothetical protein